MEHKNLAKCLRAALFLLSLACVFLLSESLYAGSTLGDDQIVFCASEESGAMTLGIDNLDGLVIHAADARIRKVESVYGRSMLKQAFGLAQTQSNKHGEQACRVEASHLDCQIQITTDPAKVDFGQPTGRLDTARLAQIEAAIQPTNVRFQIETEKPFPQVVTIQGATFSCSPNMD